MLESEQLMEHYKGEKADKKPVQKKSMIRASL